MEAWIVDDGPLKILATVLGSNGFEHFPLDTLFVAEATWGNPSHEIQRLAQTKPPRLTTISIEMGSPAADTLYTHLRQEKTADKDLAEDAAIAWALHSHPDAILVAGDKRAAYAALAELGRGRAAHPSELWLCLLDQDLITQAQFKDLCERTAKNERPAPVPQRCSMRFR